MSLSGTATASITAWSTDDNTVFTATITPTTSGTVILDIAADVATDAASNGNTAATQQSVTVDPALSTWMPDANLRSAVRSALGLADGATFTQADMEDLTSFTAKEAQISNITGIEHATSLTRLDLRDNSIVTITALSGLTSLETLKFKGNDIVTITALSGLTSLTWLGLDGNSISDLSPLEELTSLTWLYLRSNSIISDLSPLEELTSLTWLDLGGNSISDLSPLEGLTSLTWLDLMLNSISDLSPLEELTSLTLLWLNDNPILDTSPLYPLLSENGGKITSIDIDVSEYAPWDVNEDGNVDVSDSALVTDALGQTGDSIINPRTDVNGDGIVDADDLTLVTDNLDTDGGAPSSSGLLTLLDPATLEKLDPATLDAQLDILRVQSDGSLKYLRAIALLESVLAAMRPDKTQLLANYPNPFNPETWIPYHLANPSNVRITIYDARGAVVRQLDLGHQREGYYTNRSRAAYWDGRNDFGERVATGIYFYQLEADNMSLLRKMLILK